MVITCVEGQAYPSLFAKGQAYPSLFAIAKKIKKNQVLFPIRPHQHTKISVNASITHDKISSPNRILHEMRKSQVVDCC